MTHSRLLLLLLAVFMQLATQAQHAPDFAEKFMSMHEGDSTLRCITVSPKMMEQLGDNHEEGRLENIVQAISKLKSARIVNGNADYYEKALQLLKKNKRRFKAEQEFRTDSQHGAFFTRRDKSGKTVELIMICEDPQNDRFTLINLTGDIDEEFLCFLYNNKSLKN
jgi:hypothetical protein